MIVAWEMPMSERPDLFALDSAKVDAHVHLDFMTNAREVALEAQKRGFHLFANTVTPHGYGQACELVGDLPNVRVGLGAHPWWVNDVDMAEFEQLFPTTDWIGEVGLDLSPKRPSHDRQLQVFERIAELCAEAGGKTLSIHSVRAADEVLGVLERTGCAKKCRCVFHWFSGSTEAIWRAIRIGCWFSVNEMQAGTRRAREQLKLIPEDRLLFETDLPPREGEPYSATELFDSLERVRAMVSGIRHVR